MTDQKLQFELIKPLRFAYNPKNWIFYRLCQLILPFNFIILHLAPTYLNVLYWQDSEKFKKDYKMSREQQIIALRTCIGICVTICHFYWYFKNMCKTRKMAISQIACEG